MLVLWISPPTTQKEETKHNASRDGPPPRCFRRKQWSPLNPLLKLAAQAGPLQKTPMGLSLGPNHQIQGAIQGNLDISHLSISLHMASMVHVDWSLLLQVHGLLARNLHSQWWKSIRYQGKRCPHRLHPNQYLHMDVTMQETPCWLEFSKLKNTRLKKNECLTPEPSAILVQFLLRRVLFCFFCVFLLKTGDVFFCTMAIATCDFKACSFPWQ